MSQAYFRFYAELNDFLPASRRQVAFVHAFEMNAAVKDLVEALGAPHTEVDLILVNGESVDFSYRLQDGDRVSVYPVFESLDVSELVRVRPRPLREVKFVLDTHLGKLAVYLRMLGLDTLYRNDCQDDEVAHISASQGRVLLTKDRGLLKRSAVTHGYCVRAIRPREQVVEVLRRFDLLGSIAPFCRCLRCNGLLYPVPKEEIADRLLPKTRQYYQEFYLCDACGQIYWAGSHLQRMQRFVEDVVASCRSAEERTLGCWGAVSSVRETRRQPL